MSSSFQSTAFQSSARPVDTFVVEPQVLPKTQAEELALILETVNPNLQKFLSLKIEDAAQKEREKINLEIAKKGFQTVAKEHRKIHGDQSANRLIGGSIFADDEFDKVKTQLLGDTFSNQVSSLYNSKSYEITTESGKKVNVPIYHFPVDSEQFQNFLGEVSTISGNLAASTKGKYLSDYFYPTQSKVIEQITTDHIDAHNEYLFNKLSKQSFPTIVNAYSKWQDGEKDLAVESINNFINNKVLLGVTGDKQSKFFDNLLEYTKSLRSEIFAIDGLEGSLNVLEMMRGIQYGPEGSSIFETHPKFLSEMHKQTIEHTKQVEEIEKINNLNEKEEAEKGILLLVQELGPGEGELPYATIERIRQFGAKYNVDVSWIDNKIDIFAPERIKVLKDFSLILTEGTYIGRPKEATEQLGIILNSLGPLTEKERGIKTKIVSQIESSRKGQFDGGNEQVNQSIIRLRKRISPKYDALNELWIVEGNEANPSLFMTELEREFKNRYQEYAFFTDENDDGIYENRTKKEIFDFINNLEDEMNERVDEWRRKNSTLGSDDNYEFEGDPLRENNKKKNTNGSNLEAGFFSDDQTPTTVTVEKGDTLFGLADQFSTTVQAIKDANGLESDLIIAGQELIMPIGDEYSKETNKVVYSQSSKQQSIVKAADKLGIKPEVLASVISQETMGTFDNRIVGGENNNYRGLIQFGIEEREQYGYKDNMSFEEQVLGPVVKYLKDRGVKPNHGVKEVYAAILTGNVSTLDTDGLTRTDSFGTSVQKALPNLIEGGSHYLNGLDFLQEKGKFTPKTKSK